MSKPVRTSAVIFDLYNTLIEIRTDERDLAVWDQLARFLSYRGWQTSGESLRLSFMEQIDRSREASGEEHPEIDMPGLFQQILRDAGQSCPQNFHVHLAQLFRSLSMRRFQLFPDTLRGLQTLAQNLKLAIVSDAQRVFLEPEMEQLGLTAFFDTRVISFDYRFRKPDPRLFAIALRELQVKPDEAIYVGDDTYRDICGARCAGIRAVLLQRASKRQKPDEMCKPDLVVRDLDELVMLLQPFNQAR